jgi:hypothetical protein
MVSRLRACRGAHEENRPRRLEHGKDCQVRPFATCLASFKWHR